MIPETQCRGLGRWRHNLTGEAVSVVGLDVGIDLVNGSIKRVHDIRPVGDVGHRLLEGEGRRQVGRCWWPDQGLRLAETKEHLERSTRRVALCESCCTQRCWRQAVDVGEHCRVFSLDGELDESIGSLWVLAARRDAILPGSGTDLWTVAEIGRWQEQHVIAVCVERSDSRPVAVPLQCIFAVYEAGVTVGAVLRRARRQASFKQALPPLAKGDRFVAVEDTFSRQIVGAVDDVATKALQEGREGIRIPLTRPGHTRVKGVFKLAGGLQGFKRRIELFKRPRLIERGDTDTIRLQHRATGVHRAGCIPQTNRVDLAVPFTDRAGQEPVEGACGKIERYEIACPGPVGHHRPVHVDDVRKITRQGSRHDGFVVAVLGEVLHLDNILTLRSVEVLNDLYDHRTLLRVASPVIPETQCRGLFLFDFDRWGLGGLFHRLGGRSRRRLGGRGRCGFGGASSQDHAHRHQQSQNRK